MTASTTSPETRQRPDNDRLAQDDHDDHDDLDDLDDLVGRLELAFRLLGKRVYLPSLRVLRAAGSGQVGVDKTSYPLLALLAEHDEVRPSDAAVALELDLSTVSRQVRQLEQSGLVARRPDEADGRACRIHLTDHGRAGLCAVRRSRSQLLDSTFGGWSSTDREEFLRLLDRLLTDLHNMSPTSPTSPTPPPLTPAPLPSTPETDR